MTFTDEFLEELFLDKNIRKCPLSAQSTFIHALEGILTKKVEANNYVTISELLSSDGLSEQL